MKKGTDHQTHSEQNKKGKEKGGRMGWEGMFLQRKMTIITIEKTEGTGKGPSLREKGLRVEGSGSGECNTRSQP